ncbi:MAG TPA: hypothetical protein VD772_11545, partial [Anseongella sp.]|nr:hypothetical protein [Anseongella sp.]
CLVLSGAFSRKIEGYYISLEKDTAALIFNIPFIPFIDQPDFIRLQQGVACSDVLHKRRLLKPGDAREIGFTYKGRLFRMRSFRPAGMWDSVFLKLEVDGTLKLYRFFHRGTSHHAADSYYSRQLDYYGAEYWVSNPAWISGGQPARGYPVSGGEYMLQQKDKKLLRTGLIRYGNGPLAYLPDHRLGDQEIIRYLSDCKAAVDKKSSGAPLEEVARVYNRECTD